MYKITLFCAGGMSTSLLVNKMKEAAAKKGKADAYDIHAYGLSETGTYAPDSDVILLGPQVRYAERQLRQQYPGKKIVSMDMRYYGTMNGKAILEQAEQMLEED